MRLRDSDLKAEEDVELTQPLMKLTFSPPDPLDSAFSLINKMFAHESSMKSTFFCRKPRSNFTEALANLFDDMTPEMRESFPQAFTEFLNNKCSTRYHSLNYFLARLVDILLFAGSAIFLTNGINEKDKEKLLYGIACGVALLSFVKITTNTNAIAKVIDEVNQLVVISTRLKKTSLNNFFYRDVKHETTYSLYQQFQGQSLDHIRYILENEKQSQSALARVTTRV